MKKPMAILKDSLREARDSKVLLVLLALSTLVLVFIFSIGFEPVAPDDMVSRAQADFPAVQLNHGRDPLIIRRRVKYEIRDFRDVKPASNPAKGTYSFTLKATPLEEDDGAPGDPRFPGRPKKDGAAVGGGNAGAKGDEGKPADKGPKKDDGKGDAFTQSVALWNVDLGELGKLIRQTQTIGEDAPIPESRMAITPQLMEDFVKEKFEYHYNVRVTECRRGPGPLMGPQEFAVTIEGSDPRAWPHQVSLFFGAWSPRGLRYPLGVIVWVVEDQLVNGFGAGIAILMGIIITAFFIPEMMRKGAIDLLLAKPINRIGLLFWKYLGGLSFMLILTTFNVVGVWLILGVRSGIWNPKFLLAIPLLVFSFAVLYAVSTLMAVLTRSAVVSILVTCVFAGLLYILGQAYSVYDTMNNTPGLKEEIPEWVHTTATIVHGVMPRTKDIDSITSKLIAEAMTEADQRRNLLHLVTYPSWGAAIGVSCVWIAVILGLANWRFVTRDY